jgi:hypothetical protein
MGNRIFVSVVLLLWASTMSWLVVARILPPFYQGEPPQPSLQSDEVVAWKIHFKGVPVGWAMSQASSGVSGAREIHSRVILTGLPLREMAPEWMGSLVSTLEPVDLDARTRLSFDGFGQLASMESKIGLNGVPAVLRLWGNIEQTEMRLRMQTGEVIHETTYPISERAFISTELMPEPKLSRMYVGRRWQRAVVSPFESPTSPVEIIQAEVVAEESLLHGGERIKTRRIEYRTMSAPGVALKNTLHAVIWVGEEGTVLRQDVYVMSDPLRFDRALDPGSVKYAEQMLDMRSVSSGVP